jgi:hypothetical protein
VENALPGSGDEGRQKASVACFWQHFIATVFILMLMKY